MVKPTVICLTPIRNEAWVLDRFLKCSSLWADHIIIADQNSTDDSREIAKSYPKVMLIENPSTEYNELERQNLLIQAARKIQGQRLLITLDADEVLSANFMESAEWNTVLHAPVGTVIKFQWVNLRPDMYSCWLPEYEFAWGFMDDGSEHYGASIHSPRIPLPIQAPSIVLRQIKVLHYQYTEWERMRSKHRWYQCWEKLNKPTERAVNIYRRYHHMDAVPKAEIKTLQKKWFAGYEEREIDMTSTNCDSSYWWDQEVINWFDTFGTAPFKKLDIWDVNWNDIAKKLGIHSQVYSDPRSKFDKFAHRWLRKTQAVPNYRTRLVEKIIKQFGW